MKTVDINLNEISAVKSFCRIAQLYDCSIMLKHNTVNAKSIMGLFTLDLSQPVDVTIKCDNEDVINSFMNDIKRFVLE